MRTITTTVYTINEHPNKQLCFEWIRNNWYDLNQHTIDEVITSIEALSEKIGGTFDYSINQTSDIGEYIRFKNYDKHALQKLNIEKENCTFTGYCYDIDVIGGLANDTMCNVLDAIHNETEYIYSDDGLTELCEINGYEFNLDGSIV